MVFNNLLKWTHSIKNHEVFIQQIQLQQCGCWPLVRMFVSRPQTEPYEMTVYSETEPLTTCTIPCMTAIDH